MIARLNRTPHVTADAEGRKSYMRFLPPLLAAVAAALVFFAGVTTGHISMDDWGYIYGCPFVRDGLSAANVAAAFSQFGYDAFWMPLTFISYMADITFFGGGWAVHHAVCVAIHAANAALAFVLLKRLASVFAPEASPRETALACLAAALFWALHPMRAEAVVYIAARKDLLWTFFALLGLIAWIGHIRRGGGVSLALATACCVLACLSKPTAVCFPFLAFALEWAAHGRFPRRLWRYAPMMATAVLVGAITLYCQSNPIDHERLDVFGEPLWWRVLNAAVASGMYLWHVVAPGGIRFDYRAVFGGCPLDCAFALSVLGLVLALFAVSLRFAGSRLRAALWLAAAWAVFSIGPVSGVLGTVNGDHAYADRYTYFPALSVSLVLAVALLGLRPRRRLFAAAVAFVVVAAASTIPFTVAVARSYRDDYSAFSRTLAKDPDHWRALRVVGSEYCARLGRMDEGVAMLRRSLGLRPSQRTADALAYVLALRCAPGDVAEVRRLGAAVAANAALDRTGFMLEALGLADLAEGGDESAARRFAAALKVPARAHSDLNTRLGLGYALANLGRTKEALALLDSLRDSTDGEVRFKAAAAARLIRNGRQRRFQGL